ncbi:hypothetical protein GCM10010255_80500 [Streptomyces coeruleofuscus]|uniref:Uncharacterized protein n=1 Tax=Streptomyces coeruleofuscus TaxID=66879 RepID=A0ABN3JE27_9ACTN
MDGAATGRKKGGARRGNRPGEDTGSCDVGHAGLTLWPLRRGELRYTGSPKLATPNEVMHNDSSHGTSVVWHDEAPTRVLLVSRRNLISNCSAGSQPGGQSLRRGLPKPFRWQMGAEPR